MSEKIHRVNRTEKLTSAEAERVNGLRQQLQAELPEIKRRAKQRQVALGDAVRCLKEERERQGLSLSDIRARTGMESSALSRLENDPESNPTVATLNRYASALGKSLMFTLVDAPST